MDDSVTLLSTIGGCIRVHTGLHCNATLSKRERHTLAERTASNV